VQVAQRVSAPGIGRSGQSVSVCLCVASLFSVQKLAGCSGACGEACACCAGGSRGIAWRWDSGPSVRQKFVYVLCRREPAGNDDNLRQRQMRPTLMETSIYCHPSVNRRFFFAYWSGRQQHYFSTKKHYSSPPLQFHCLACKTLLQLLS
jgi:hypothetical protein